MREWCVIRVAAAAVGLPTLREVMFRRKWTKGDVTSASRRRWMKGDVRSPRAPAQTMSRIIWLQTPETRIAIAWRRRGFDRFEAIVTVRLPTS